MDGAWTAPGLTLPWGTWVTSSQEGPQTYPFRPVVVPGHARRHVTYPRPLEWPPGLGHS